MKIPLIILSFTLLVIDLQAGEFNKKLSVGDAAPQWKDLPGVDGKDHSFDEWKAKKYLIVVFTCNSCACSVDYEDRIIAFANKYAAPKTDVALVAINVNTIPDDRLNKMKERAKAKKFPFPYLYDESQQIARDYGAVYTPEFFLLNAERKIAYMGSFDDKINPSDVKVKYLEDALLALQAGKAPPQKETLAKGCLIRFKRVRD
ncbi:MAG: thioredoxin family protein [Zavarzinella sp.]